MSAGVLNSGFAPGRLGDVLGVSSLRWRRDSRVQARSRGLGRLVAIVAIAALLVGAGYAVVRAAGTQAVSVPAVVGDAAVLSPVPGTYEHIVVEGDTLWGLATAIAGDGDPREYVDEIISLNHLPSANVSVGRALLLPVKS